MILSNNNLGTIPLHAFRGIQGRIIRLDLANCSLTVFPRDALSVFTELMTLRLTENQITEIPDGSFRQFPHLRELYLGDNPLRNVNRERLLSGLKSTLRVLYLQYLNITTFPTALLKNLRRLGYVALDNNHIEVLPANMLEGFRTRLQLSLMLSGNRIYNVSRDFLQRTNIKIARINLSDNRLTNLDFIDLCLPSYKIHRQQYSWDINQPIITIHDNPLQCDCKLRTLMNRRNVKFIGNCAQPPALRDMSFHEIKRLRFNVTRNNEEFSCQHMEKINCTRPSLQALTGTDIQTVNGGR